MNQAPHFILNPAAAGGRAARWWKYAWPVLQERLAGATFAVANDRYSLGDRLAAAVEQGREEIVGVGGDGTHHDLVNAAVDRSLTGAFTYTPLPLGSGNDWCRTLGVPRHILYWLRVFEDDVTQAHRIGRLVYGEEEVRYFINSAGLAFDAEVVRRSDATAYKHRFLYPLLTARYLPSFRPPELTLDYDGHRVTGRFHTIGFGIGRCKGGGMRMFPHADPTADTLALTFAADVPLRRIAAHGWRLYTGSIGRVPGVTTTHAKSISVAGTTGLEADGEYLGHSPVRADLIDQRLRVRVRMSRD